MLVLMKVFCDSCVDLIRRIGFRYFQRIGPSGDALNALGEDQPRARAFLVRKTDAQVQFFTDIWLVAQWREETL
jgi:hypothetical protein